MTPRCQLLERRWPVLSSSSRRRWTRRTVGIATALAAMTLTSVLAGCSAVPVNLPQPQLPKLPDLSALGLQDLLPFDFGPFQSTPRETPSASPSPSDTSDSASPSAAPTPSALPDPTECLQREIVNLRIDKDGTDYGFGGEIFVEFQVRFTNRCTQAVKAVEYEATFQDAFRDEIMMCFGKVSLRIPVGESKSSPKNTGCYVGAGEPTYQSWTVANKADITSEAKVSRVVFADGSISSRVVI